MPKDVMLKGGVIKIKLYRRRFIPNEIFELKNDLILAFDNDIIVTKWKAIRPRDDFDWGCSCYHLKEGFKISKFFDRNNNFLYWYCDIIDVVFDKEEDAFIFNDLLVDVVVYKDGLVKVLDLDELADAFESNLIDDIILKKALRQLNMLLNIIYSGHFHDFTKSVEYIS